MVSVGSRFSAGAGWRESRCRGAAGDCPGPFGGVDVKHRAVAAIGVAAIGVAAIGVAAIGWAGQVKREGLLVGAGPVGDHVGDQPAMEESTITEIFGVITLKSFRDHEKFRLSRWIIVFWASLGPL
jgi:hypothetical protein